MPLELADQALFLFVPADRPERFSKAAAAGADSIIIDLEDAVSPVTKNDARRVLTTALASEPLPGSVFVRINGVGTSWHDADVEALTQLQPDGVVLPKAESCEQIERLRERLPAHTLIIALIETAIGLTAARTLAEKADRLAFGSIDLAADLGCAHSREALLFARSQTVLASRLAGKPAPIDGVTLSIKDDAATQTDARYAAELGFGGKLLIHPAQIEPCREGLAPTLDNIAWASKILSQTDDGAARAVDGTMVDLPVLLRARQILHAHQRFSKDR